MHFPLKQSFPTLNAQWEAHGFESAPSLEEQRISSPSRSRLKTSLKRVCWIQNKFHILHLPGQLAQGNHPTSWIWQADTRRFSILNTPVIFGICLLASEGFLWDKGGLLFNLPHIVWFKNIWGWGNISDLLRFLTERNWVIISPFHQLKKWSCWAQGSRKYHYLNMQTDKNECARQLLGTYLPKHVQQARGANFCSNENGNCKQKQHIHVCQEENNLLSWKLTMTLRSTG